MDLAGVEIELARAGDHLTRLRETLAPLRKSGSYDYCIMDTPPSLGVLMTSALAACDEVLTPLQCEWFGLEGPCQDSARDRANLRPAEPIPTSGMKAS